MTIRRPVRRRIRSWYPSIAAFGERNPMRPSLAAFVLLATVAAAPPRADVAQVDQGRVLYLSNCSRCHGQTGIGNGEDAALLADKPADLRRSEVLEAYPDEVLVDRIRGTRKLHLEFRPRAIARHAEETESLYRFVRSLPSIHWATVERGGLVFLERCSLCHGLYGRGQPPYPPGVTRPPRDLSDPSFQSATDAGTLTELVRHGKRSMPGLVPRLTEGQANDVAAYVRILSPGFTLYDGLCSTCHGRRGEGATGALEESRAPRFAFDAAYFRTHDPEEVRGKIWHMLEDVKPGMPHFAELSAEQVKEILAYLRSLPPLPRDLSGESLP
jgi:mono/diheme cytochrome c family protein